MRLPGFIGPSYTLRSKNFDAQRCVNLYPEINELGSGKEREVAALVSTPGLTHLLDVGDGPIRCIQVDSSANGEKILVISGSKCYVITYSGGSWSSTLLSTTSAKTLDTTEGPVIAAATSNYVVFADGDMNSVFVDEVAPTADYFSRFDSLGYPGVPTATHVAYIDGYLVYNEDGTGNFYVSDLSNALSVSAADFATAEGDPDKIQGLIANTRDLWLFGERTTEVWVNTGNADFPFERVSGGFIEVGCLARYSIAKIAGAVLWLGRDEHGQGSVYMAKGVQPQRISTHAIETAIQGYASPEDAVAYTYQDGGHQFYVLNFDETTWVYDLSTQLWHERTYTNSSGVMSRHLINCMAYIPSLGIHIGGDYESASIYQLDNDVYTDDGDRITRLRSSPHVSQGLGRIFCSSFQLDMETGTGLDASVQGSDPQVMLDWSDDGGHTWSNEHFGSMGKIGQKYFRAIWRRLGFFRDRIFRVKITDPVKVVILGAEIDVQQGGK